MNRPNMIRHVTPEEAIKEFLSPAMEEASEDDPRCFGFGGISSDGETSELSYEDALSAVRKVGLWGFANVPAREIHFWSDGSASPSLRMQFLGHELAHLILVEQAPEAAEHDDDLAEEVLADDFGQVAALAYELLPELD